MNFEKVNKEWLNNWNSKEITKDAFITANSFSNKCIKQIGIKPHCCIKKLGKDCKTC